MRHSKGTKVTKDEYYVIKTALDHGTTTQAKISHDFRRSPYTLKRIKDSKSYNDYLMMVGRQEVDAEEYKKRPRQRPVFNCSDVSSCCYKEYEQDGNSTVFLCKECGRPCHLVKMLGGYDDKDEYMDIKKEDIEGNLDLKVDVNRIYSDDEDVEWEVKPDDFSIIQDQITEVQDKIDVLDERIDKVYSLIKRIDRAISYIWR
jgi:hypothetical protein